MQHGGLKQIGTSDGLRLTGLRHLIAPPGRRNSGFTPQILRENQRLHLIAPPSTARQILRRDMEPGSSDQLRSAKVLPQPQKTFVP